MLTLMIIDPWCTLAAVFVAMELSGSRPARFQQPILDTGDTLVNVCVAVELSGSRPAGHLCHLWCMLLPELGEGLSVERHAMHFCQSVPARAM